MNLEKGLLGTGVVLLQGRRSSMKPPWRTVGPHRAYYLGQRSSLVFKSVRTVSTTAKVGTNAEGVPFNEEAMSSTEVVGITRSEDEDAELMAANPKGFSFELALLAAAFSFETYSEPRNSRWERGSKGCDVAFKSNSFTRAVYKGLVELTILAADELSDPSAGERMLSGSGVDLTPVMRLRDDSGEGMQENVDLNDANRPVCRALVEGDAASDAERIEQRVNEGVLSLEQCSNIVRTSTVWANNKDTKLTGNMYTKRTNTWEWGQDESHYLYARDPDNTRLALTLVDENIMNEDEIMGVCTVRMLDLLGPVADVGVNGSREWTGWMKLTSKPTKKNKSGQIALGSAAGAMMFGPIGGAAGGYLASLWEGGVEGRVKLRLRYFPLSPPERPSVEKEERLSASEGVDWARLGASVGGDAATQNDYELCAFVTHKETGCTAGLYRSTKHKRLVVAFRGTCSPVDLITDASLLQQSWVEGLEEDEKQVHAGFRTSLQSISRRLKELTIAAAEGGMEDWDLLVTGHSLGGALATLFACDVGEAGLDSGRGLPQLANAVPWWSRFGSVPKNQSQSVPRPRKLQVYTFGSPRVGNEAFAEHFESLGIEEVYRVVNGEDVVARVPRSMNALLASVNYTHCGRTALVTESDLNPTGAADLGDQDALERLSTAVVWVEGESSMDNCPVRDASPLTNPFQKGNVLGDVVSTFSEIDLRGGWNVADKVGSAVDAMGSLISKVGAKEAASIVGIDTKFVTRELELLQSIRNGSAIDHHLEPAYFNAMTRAAKAASSNDGSPVMLPPAKPIITLEDLDPKWAAVVQNLKQLEACLVSEQQRVAFKDLKSSLEEYMEDHDMSTKTDHLLLDESTESTKGINSDLDS